MIISTENLSLKVISAFVLRELLCGSSDEKPVIEDVWPRYASGDFVAAELEKLFLDEDCLEVEWMLDLLKYLNSPMSPENSASLSGRKVFFSKSLRLQRIEPHRCFILADKVPTLVGVEHTLNIMIIDRESHNIRVIDVVPSNIHTVEILAGTEPDGPRNVVVHLNQGAQPNVFVNAIGSSCDMVMLTVPGEKSARALDTAISELKAQALGKAANIRRDNPVLGPCELIEVSEGRILPFVGTSTGPVSLKSDVTHLEREADRSALIEYTYNVTLENPPRWTLDPSHQPRLQSLDVPIIWNIGDGKDILAARQQRADENHGPKAGHGDAQAEDAAKTFLDGLAETLENRPEEQHREPAPTVTLTEADGGDTSVIYAEPEEMEETAFPLQSNGEDHRGGEAEEGVRPTRPTHAITEEIQGLLAGVSEVLREIVELASGEALSRANAAGGATSNAEATARHASAEQLEPDGDGRSEMSNGTRPESPAKSSPKVVWAHRASIPDEPVDREPFPELPDDTTKAYRNRNTAAIAGATAGMDRGTSDRGRVKTRARAQEMATTLPAVARPAAKRKGHLDADEPQAKRQKMQGATATRAQNGPRDPATSATVQSAPYPEQTTEAAPPNKRKREQDDEPSTKGGKRAKNAQPVAKRAAGKKLREEAPKSAASSRRSKRTAAFKANEKMSRNRPRPAKTVPEDAVPVTIEREPEDGPSEVQYHETRGAGDDGGRRKQASAKKQPLTPGFATPGISTPDFLANVGLPPSAAGSFSRHPERYARPTDEAGRGTPPRPAMSPTETPRTPPRPSESPALSLRESWQSYESSPSDAYFQEKMESQLKPGLFAHRLSGALERAIEPAAQQPSPRRLRSFRRQNAAERSARDQGTSTEDEGGRKRRRNAVEAGEEPAAKRRKPAARK